MLNENFIYLGALLSFLGSLNYLTNTVKGKTKPNRVTWFMWALAPLVAFSAEIDEGVGLQSLMTFMVGFNPLLIFIASFFNKKAYWELKKIDYFYGSLSAFGLVLWWLTGNGNLAIMFALIADGLAGIPTITKSWREPKTESSFIFLAGILNASITILTIDKFDFAHLAFPLYIFCLCLILYVLIKFEVGKKFQKKETT